MDDATWAADEAFGKMLPRETAIGYRIWATPLARRMATSLMLTKTVSLVALPWAREMAYQAGMRNHGSLVGRLVMALGVPACTIIGTLVIHLRQAAPQVI